MQAPGNQNAYKQEAPPLVQVDMEENGQPLIDPNMIAEVIRRYFGVQLRPLDRLVYRKPYPNQVDRVPLPRGYKTLDFSTFSDENGKSTMEHVSWCGEANQNEYYKLQLFPLSFTEVAFSWYSSPAPNSYQSRPNMEKLFHDCFHKPQPEVSIAKLTSLSRSLNELVAEFLDRFRRLRSQCSVQLLESQCVTIAVNNMHPQLRERLVAIKYSDLA